MPVIERPTLFTVGHSTRSIDEFVDIVRGGAVQRIVDVRTLPRSRTNPQFNGDSLGQTLAPYQLGYRPIAALGGRRGRSKSVEPSVNAWWTHQSFHNYADYALSADFAAGLDELLALAEEQPTAIMCSEAVWWRCHRRIIADYAMLRGLSVRHLMAAGRIEEARMTPSARVGEGKLTYPRSAHQG